MGRSLWDRNPEASLSDVELAGQEERILGESMCWPGFPTDAEKRAAVEWCNSSAEREALTDAALKVAKELSTLPRPEMLAARVLLATDADLDSCVEALDYLRLAGFLRAAIVISAQGMAHRSCVLLPPLRFSELCVDGSSCLIRPPGDQQGLNND